jgi:serine/threonine-protein phosphatase 2A regulatory subunit A
VSLYSFTTAISKLYQTIAPSLTLEVIRDNVLQVLIDLTVDPIPNIRFNVAKSLEVISTTINVTAEGLELSRTQIVPAVEVLRNDADADVRYFANKALLKANPS